MIYLPSDTLLFSGQNSQFCNVIRDFWETGLLPGKPFQRFHWCKLGIRGDIPALHLAEWVWASGSQDLLAPSYGVMSPVLKTETSERNSRSVISVRQSHGRLFDPAACRIFLLLLQRSLSLRYRTCVVDGPCAVGKPAIPASAF